MSLSNPDNSHCYYHSVFSVPQVKNWATNIHNGMTKYFWDDAIYYLTKIMKSFAPLMRFCVELRIEGKSPAEIAEITGKSVNNVYLTLKREKKDL